MYDKSIAEMFGNEGDTDAIIYFVKAVKLFNDTPLFGFLLVMGNLYE